MPERLLEMARRAADQVEIYQERVSSTEVRFSNGKAEDVQSSMLAGITLRLLKAGRLGFSCSRNADRPEHLIEGAMASLAAGVAGPGSFASPAVMRPLETLDPAIETVTTGMMADECRRASEALARRVGGFDRGTVGCGLASHLVELRVLTSEGADVRSRQGFLRGTASLAFPGTAANLSRPETAKRFTPISEASLDFLADIQDRSRSQVSVSGGRMQVLFMPSAMFTLTWRLMAGTSGRSVLLGESPLAGRLGQTVAHPGFTLLDEPWNTEFPGARSFDDEGTPTKPLALIENGVLKSFYYDRFYSGKAGQPMTGHGYKSAGGFPGNRLPIPPQPSLQHLTIKPGKSGFSDLIGMMDRGIVVFGPLGPHSGNIPNGDFSIGLAPGLVVEKGRIIGRARDAMVSGNVYETIKNLVAIGSRVEPEFMGNYPPVLFDGVSVSG